MICCCYEGGADNASERTEVVEVEWSMRWVRKDSISSVYLLYGECAAG